MSKVPSDELSADPGRSERPSVHPAVAGPDPVGQPEVTAAPPVPGGDRTRVPRSVPSRFGPRALVEPVWLDAAARELGQSVAVSCADGGVGRSTLVAALGSLLALACPDPVVAVDATERGWGGLAERVDADNAGSISDAIDTIDADPDHGFAGFVWARTGPSGLRALLNDRFTPKAQRLDDLAQVLTVADTLRPWHAAVLLDLPVADTRRVWLALAQADVPVLVARASTDSLRHTLQLLTAMGEADFTDVVRRVVVVISCTQPSPPKAVQAVARQLTDQVAALVTVPYDPGLAAPEPVDVRRLNRRTRRALLRVAAAVVSDRTAQTAGSSPSTAVLAPAAVLSAETLSAAIEEVLP